MSIVVVSFPGCPKVSADAVERNRKLDTRLEQKVQGMLFHQYLYVFRFKNISSPKITPLNSPREYKT